VTGTPGGKRRRLPRLAQFVILAVITASLVGTGDRPDASAAIAADFDAGNIISDTVFFGSSAMSADQVQAFLTARGGSCDSAQRPCLKTYTTTTVAKAADGLCQGYAGGQVQSAARIIAGVAQSCGINPQVLLVLLEKEQRLVTRSDPSNVQYAKAVGFACPDTSAGCDANYSGLFNQLYHSARRFQDYAARPASFRYKAGQWNSILWNVESTGCGAGNVFIANQATAGLYNYTPYQPNAAAMANLYGTGDGCSAYGNRNFWRMFTDWFGNPQAGGGSLMRTLNNATVYVVSGSMKYPVGDLSTLASLAPLGPVGYVSQQYLDRRTTGPLTSRFVLAPNGTVFFFDSGIKLALTSCPQVADFGGSCGSLVRWEQPLIDALHTGPLMAPIYRTTTGKAFYVAGGVKREAVDDAALVAAGLPTHSVRLQEAGVAHLPYGPPVLRDGVVLQNRSSSATTVAAGGALVTVSEAVAATALSSLPVRPLDEASMRFLTTSSATGAFVQEAGGSRVFLLTGQGKKVVTDPAMAPASVPQMPAAVLGLMPDAGTLDAGTFVKGSTSSTVFALRAGQVRGIGAWADLIALNGGDPAPRILVTDQRIADLLPRGPMQRGPGTMVVSPRNATVYLVDGYDGLIPVSSFTVTGELGASRLTAVPATDIDAYTVRPGVATVALECAGTRYLGIGGKLYTVGADVAAHYPALTYTTVDATTCAALAKGGALGRFLRDSNGTIFYVEDGLKRPITSIGTYLALGGNGSNTIQASAYTLSLVPNGALLSSVAQLSPATAPAEAAPSPDEPTTPAAGSDTSTEEPTPTTTPTATGDTPDTTEAPTTTSSGTSATPTPTTAEPTP
jgi:hypothetical protein